MDNIAESLLKSVLALLTETLETLPTDTQYALTTILKMRIEELDNFEEIVNILTTFRNINFQEGNVTTQGMLDALTEVQNEALSKLNATNV